MKLSAFGYYLNSFFALLKKTNFWQLPSLVFQKYVRLKIPGYKFYVKNLMDVWAIKEVILDGCYVQLQQVKKKDIVIDIGAGIGDFSIMAGKIGAEVFAFEMSKERVDLFKRNISLNKCFDIKIFETKISSLETIFHLCDVEFCNFLKIDCEGCEYQILNSASLNLLKRIKYISMEAHLFNGEMVNKYDKMKSKLKKANFKLKELDNPVHRNLKFLFARQKIDGF